MATADYRKKATEVFDEWLSEQLIGEASVDLPKLRDKAFAFFINNQDFVKQWFAETFPSSIYSRITSRLGQARQGWITLGDRVVSPSQFQQDAKVLGARFKRWDYWWESIGPGQTMRFMDMFPDQLLLMETNRRKSGQHEYIVADVAKTVRGSLKETQTVSDEFTSEMVEDIYQSLMPKKEPKNGNIRQRKSGPVYNLPRRSGVPRQSHGRNAQRPTEDRSVDTKEHRNNGRDRASPIDDSNDGGDGHRSS